MIELSNVSLSLDAGLEANESLRRTELASLLKIDTNQIISLRIIRRGVDARSRKNIHFVATLCAEFSEEIEICLLDKPPRGVQVKIHKPYKPLEIKKCATPSLSPVVVGAGPAGLFAALYLARSGLKPLLIEQGQPVEQRQKDIESFIESGVLDSNSNIQFGEGGAGTFSDGKLTTNTKNMYTPHVLHWFVEAGAPEEILWQGNPHLGSDNLPNIVRTMRQEIISLGGQVLFQTRLSGIIFKENKLSSIELENVSDSNPLKRTLPCETLVLACGHSARDTFVLCRDSGLAMEQKPFSVGVRIEHPQDMINRSLWGSVAHHPALGAAAYKLAVHLPNGRSVYTFCMCPGGTVVAAASEQQAIVTNGMSNFARDGRNANAALLVNVEPKDFPNDDVLAGVQFQREIEQAAYKVSLQHGGKPYEAPAQTVGSFLKNKQKSKSLLKHDVESTYTRGIVDAPLAQCFPTFITESLALALPLLGKKLKGFDDPHAVMIAPETRSSSPVRICRTKDLQAYFPGDSQENSLGSGLYPCGEGPGYAGGIMSAAVDGLRVASKVSQRYQ